MPAGIEALPEEAFHIFSPDKMIDLKKLGHRIKTKESIEQEAGFSNCTTVFSIKGNSPKPT